VDAQRRVDVRIVKGCLLTLHILPFSCCFCVGKSIVHELPLSACRFILRSYPGSSSRQFSLWSFGCNAYLGNEAFIGYDGWVVGVHLYMCIGWRISFAIDP
jgi:hypothetical protein